MAGEKPDVLLIGANKPVMVRGLEPKVTLHYLVDAKDQDAFIKSIGDKMRAIAVAYTANKVDAAFMQSFPSSNRFPASASATITSTPNGRARTASSSPTRRKCSTKRSPTPRSASCSARCANFRRPSVFCAPANGRKAQYPLTKATLRNRTVGMVGMGRIGKAIARRLEAFGVPVVYHSRNPQTGVAYKYYPKLLDMARDVDTLMVIVPGGAATANMINAEVLKALGPNGILINMARGSVVDEPALIEALKNRTIYSAGLDVFAKEPQVPKELMEMDHIVLFPHLGSSTEVTRAAMDQLVVDNILAWAAGKPPLTPVPETPPKHS